MFIIVAIKAVMENSSQNLLCREPLVGGRRQAEFDEARSEAAVSKLFVGTDVVTQRYTRTGIMLCPVKLVALFAASRVVTRSLSSLYDDRLFLLSF